MSRESKLEKEITFKRIREDASVQMAETIENCNAIAYLLGLGELSLPNIIDTYASKIVALEEEFTKSDIDFYDRFQCESRFILEQRLQALILKAKEYLSSFVSTCDNSSSLTYAQKKKAMFDIVNFRKCNRKIENFSIKQDMIEAILFSKILSTANGFSDFDERILKIDTELQKLGYNSISTIVMQEIVKQNLSLSKINSLVSVPIPG